MTYKSYNDYIKCNNTENCYNYIYIVMHHHGIKYYKKHGNWIRLDLHNGFFYEMDSWNGAIKLKRGSGEYNEWNGFEGKTIHYFGLNTAWNHNVKRDINIIRLANNLSLLYKESILDARIYL